MWRPWKLFLVLGCVSLSLSAGGCRSLQKAPEEPVESHGDVEEAAVAGQECGKAWTPSLVGEFQLVDYPGRNDLGPDGTPPISMAKDYVFKASSYRMDGYPPLTITGDYEVLQVDGAKVRVRFYNTLFEGEPSADKELWVEFSDCGGTLVMEGMTYSKVKSSP